MHIVIILHSPWQRPCFCVFSLRECTLTFCSSGLMSCPPEIAGHLAIVCPKYHYTYYKCHYPFIFHGTATFEMTFLYSYFYYFCSLTGFVLVSDILFCYHYFVFVAYSHAVWQTYLPPHAFIFIGGIHLLAPDAQFAGFLFGVICMCRRGTYFV